jgi:hypothetical protein
MQGIPLGEFQISALESPGLVRPKPGLAYQIKSDASHTRINQNRKNTGFGFMPYQRSSALISVRLPLIFLISNP